MSLVKVNRDKSMEILEKLKEICRTPKYFEKILQEIFTVFHLTMNYDQYILVGSTIRSYLSYLFDENQMTAFVEENMLLWQTVETV